MTGYTFKILNGIGGRVIPYFKGLLNLVTCVTFEVSNAIRIDLTACQILGEIDTLLFIDN